MTPVEEVKSKLDIVELVGEYLKLQSAGGYYKACCPFHQEKSPSFTVSSTKQIWHCFGCNTGGDMFTFLMKQEGFSFPEALRVLAAKAGVALTTHHDPEMATRNGRLFDALELAARFFHQAILRSSQGQIARDYAVMRGVSQDTIDEFLIGYSLPEYERLTEFLIGRKFTAQEIIDAGLAIKKEQGYGLLDRFRGRFMIPIRNIHGQVVGFVGRILQDDDKMAKYINSPQTDLYDKSGIVFGLDVAKTAIKSADLVVLVEGNMDFISSYQAGVKNVVAVSGTALTAHHLKQLRRFTHNVALCFDTDAAGIQATKKSYQVCAQEGMNISIVTMPLGEDGSVLYKDPDECIQKDITAWKNSIETKIPAMQFFIDTEFSTGVPNDPYEKKKVVHELVQMISFIIDPIEQDHWVQELTLKSGVGSSVLWDVLKTKQRARSESKSSSDEKRPLPPPSKSNVPMTEQWESLLIGIFKQFPEVAKILALEVDEALWHTDQIRSLYAQWKNGYNTDQKTPSLEEGVISAENGYIHKDISLETAALTAEREFEGKTIDQIVAVGRDIIASLKQRQKVSNIEELQRLMQEAEKSGDEDAQRRYMDEFTMLYKH